MTRPDYLKGSYHTIEGLRLPECQLGWPTSILTNSGVRAASICPIAAPSFATTWIFAATRTQSTPLAIPELRRFDGLGTIDELKQGSKRENRCAHLRSEIIEGRQWVLRLNLSSLVSTLVCSLSCYPSFPTPVPFSPKTHEYPTPREQCWDWADL